MKAITWFRTACFMLLVSVAAAPPSLAASDTALEEAARVTGVALAETRTIPNQAEFKKEDGSSNSYLQNVKRHQLELAELMAMKAIIGRQLMSMDEVSQEDIERQMRAAILLAKIMALQAQSLRYKVALDASMEIADSGFKPLMTKPDNWEGQMCNVEKQCTHIKPITGLFILALATRQTSPEHER